MVEYNHKESEVTIMEFNRELIKTDRNGSKHYIVTCSCPKCGGTGIFHYTYFNAQGVCFKCEGTGKVAVKEVIRTTEYEEKLNQRRLARQAKEREKKEIDREELINKVFPEGKVYITLGETYSIKEDIKAHNGRYDSFNGWYFTCAKDAQNFKTFAVDVKVASPDIKVTKNGYWITMVAVEKPREESKSQYIGNVGDKVEIEATFVRAFPIILVLVLFL